MTCSTVCPTGILHSLAYNGAIVLCICALFGSHSWNLYWYMCTMHLRHGDPAAVCLCSYWQRKGQLCTELLGTALFSYSTSQHAVNKTSYNPHTRWLHANTFTYRRLAQTTQCVRPLQGWKIRSYSQDKQRRAPRWNEKESIRNTTTPSDGWRLPDIRHGRWQQKWHQDHENARRLGEHHTVDMTSEPPPLEKGRGTPYSGDDIRTNTTSEG